MDKVGKDGVITVEEGEQETRLELVEGMRFDRGTFLHTSSPIRIRWKCVQNPYILIYDKKISAMKDILHILEKVAQPEDRF